MTDKEKLVELLKEVVAIQECGFGDPCPTYQTVASYLISNGVTVQGGEIQRLKEENSNLCIAINTLEEINRDLTLRIEKSKQKWVRVEERLPEVGSRVLACGEKGGVFLVKAEGEATGFGRMDGSSKYRSFTHWMPLPEPPPMKQTSLEKLSDLCVELGLKKASPKGE